MSHEDLDELGRRRTALRAELVEVGGRLKAAVLAAEDLPETEIARRAGVDRMTVRKWLGKRQRPDGGVRKGVYEGIVMIRNFTPHCVTLLREDPYGDIVGCSGYGPGGDERRWSVVDMLFSVGVARATPTTITAGVIAGVPLTVTAYGAPQGLPEPEPDVFLLVSQLTAQAAQAHGRPVGDLLTVGELVRDGSGRVVGCTSLEAVVIRT